MNRILTAIMLFVSLPFGVYAEPISVDAIKVKDGDTIKVGRDTYRMIGYDTPEVGTPRRRVSHHVRWSGDQQNACPGNRGAWRSVIRS